LTFFGEVDEMRLALAILTLAIALPGCFRLQQREEQLQTREQQFSPTAMEQSFTMKDTAIHYNPAVLQVGASRSQVQAAFGEPNASQTTDNGQTEDVYAFNPDGTKFVDPQLRPRNIAAAVFTMGTSAAVRQARIHLMEEKLTLYHVYYGPNGTIQSVKEERMSDAPASGPEVDQSSTGVQPPSH